MENNNQFEGHYVLWQIKRLSWIFKKLGGYCFENKNVLELGCGHGFFGEQLSRLGANVLCVDGRQEHINHLNNLIRRAGINNILTRLVDLECDFEHLGVFDVIIDMGLLYHLEKPEEHICSLVKMMHKDSVLILESIVVDCDRSFSFVMNEEGYDQSLTNRARILSSTAIEEVLSDCGLNSIDISSSDLNCTIHLYDWKYNNTRLIQDQDGNYFRKMWLVSKAPIPKTQKSEQERLHKRLILAEKKLADINARETVWNDEKLHFEKEIHRLNEECTNISCANKRLLKDINDLKRENVGLELQSRKKGLKILRSLVENSTGQDEKRIGIFGAGEHTEMLFQNADIRKLAPEVIFDNDRSKWALTYKGIPIRAPSMINNFNLDSVIISSKEYEEEIYYQLLNIIKTNIKIIPLYGNYIS